MSDVSARLAAEQRARVLIDQQLLAAGWVVQDKRELNLFAGRGVAVREVVMKPGHGRADYLLYVDKLTVGVVEAKPEGTPLSGVEWQSAMYADGLPTAVRVEGNGSPRQIGRAAVWDGSIDDCLHQNQLIRVRPRRELLPAFLEAVWNSPQNRAVLTVISSSSSGLHTLSVSKLKSLIVPVPSMHRQEELDAAIDDARVARARLDEQINRALRWSQVLRRSLLAAAFSGRLTSTSADL